jgi:ribosome-binding protein aMBF1 (putative translation factor)
VGAPQPVREEQTELVEQGRKDLPKLLRQERERRKMNHEQFAAVLQIRASTYHHFESGAMLPDTALARKMEHVLKQPIVISVRMAKTGWKPETGSGEGLTLGSFIKKRK